MANFANPQADTNVLRMVLASGTAALPAVVFANDVTKGLYWTVDGLTLSGLATPTNDGDAANKAYVDSAATGGVSFIHADANPNLTGNVQFVSGTNITLSQVGQAITISAAGGVIPSSNVQGTATNDNAAAGFIGQYISSGVARTPGVVLNVSAGTTITSISLTAGDWDLTGAVGFEAGSSPSVGLNAAISLVAATIPAASTFANPSADGEIVIRLLQDPNLDDVTIPIPTYRISLAGTTTLYLVAYTNATGSSGYGFIAARRAR